MGGGLTANANERTSWGDGNALFYDYRGVIKFLNCILKLGNLIVRKTYNMYQS